MVILSVNAIREKLRERRSHMDVHDKSADQQNKKILGVVIGEFNKALVFVDEKNRDHARKMIFALLFRSEDDPFTELSSKELTPGEILALHAWIGSQKIDDRWIVRDAFMPEVIRFYNRAKYLDNYCEAMRRRTMQPPNIGKLITEIYPLEIGENVEAEKQSLLHNAILSGGEPVKSPIKYKLPVGAIRPASVSYTDDDIIEAYGGAVML